jgi:hypothetical protein
MALLGVDAREAPAGGTAACALRVRAYSAALARNAAMSMMKPDANQTTSTGMTEIMGVTHVHGKQHSKH